MKRRSPAEHNLDRLLYQEYLRRMSVVVEGQPVKVNPLYFYPYHIAKDPEEFDIEIDYFVIKRMRESYIRAISKLALFYMKCAQQGNEAASQAYRVYEPLLLLYCLGGFILKEHGCIEVGGGAFHQYSWQLLIGKEPIDIYDRAAKAWDQRNWEHAIAQFNGSNGQRRTSLNPVQAMNI